MTKPKKKKTSLSERETELLGIVKLANERIAQLEGALHAGYAFVWRDRPAAPKP